jgi:hypothetical protein
MSAAAIEGQPHAVFLPAEGALRRLPRAPRRPRPAGVLEGYEDRALAYDAFWHQDGRRILLVGPPPRNLAAHYKTARYAAGRATLRATHHVTISTMITELEGAPLETREIALELGGTRHTVTIGANRCDAFAGRRLLFTMSKDNDLAWIAEWARWHQRLHQADAIVLFDNGSTRYGIAEIEETLRRVEGIAVVSVVSWPWRYGVTDRAVWNNPFYVLYLQVGAMNVLLRRFGMQAAAIVNADVDELIATPAGTSIFDLARQSRGGLVSMRGRYIEPLASADAPAQRTHRHYRHRLADDKRAQSRPRKWAIDPSRSWFASLGVQPYMHWIEGRPPFSKSTPAGVFYRHFRAINTNWKDERTTPRHDRAGDLVLDQDFADLVARNAF